ncbi:T9SS type A sorting domain-containing protein [bacterium]|nr:T9SS type A sorting domain-containing protein [bacterium]
MNRQAPLFLVLTLSLLVAGPLVAQPSQDCQLGVGTNIAGPVDYGSEWPFVNAFKYSRTWTIQNSVWVGGGENPWDYEALHDSLQVDMDGYPLYLPQSFASAETSVVVAAVFANPVVMPQGDYVMLYEGVGTFETYSAFTITSSEPGRLVIHVDADPNDNIGTIRILTSDESDPVRNIRFIMPGHEETYASEPFEPNWLEKLEPFNSIRFMDWGITNNSILSSWEERPHVDDYTWTRHGVPYEWMVRLCNMTQKDMWICVPHLADDTYIENLAILVRDSLDTNLEVYVEYSNETWNWMFEQTHYLNDNGDQDVPWPERTVPYIQNTLDIWSGVFEGQMDRLTRVVGVQGGYFDVANRVASNLREGSVDALSPAAYFHFTSEGYEALETAGEDATVEMVLEWAEYGMDHESYPAMVEMAGLAETLGLELLFYEGGQHLTPNPFGSVQPYNQALVDAQLDDGMYDLYADWLDRLRNLSDDPKLLMNFSFMSPLSGRYGSWGALTSVDLQPPYIETAPKYQALLEAIVLCEETGIGEGGRAHMPSEVKLLPNQPNPFNPVSLITYQLPADQPVSLSLFNVMGQRVMVLDEGHRRAGLHQVQLDASGLASGVYLYQLEAGNRKLTRKLMLLK